MTITLIKNDKLRIYLRIICQETSAKSFLTDPSVLRQTTQAALTQSEVLSGGIAAVLAVKLVRDDDINVSGVGLVGTTVKRLDPDLCVV